MRGSVCKSGQIDPDCDKSCAPSDWIGKNGSAIPQGVEINAVEERPKGALCDPRQVGNDATQRDPAQLGARQERAGHESLDA